MTKQCVHVLEQNVTEDVFLRWEDNLQILTMKWVIVFVAWKRTIIKIADRCPPEEIWVHVVIKFQSQYLDEREKQVSDAQEDIAQQRSILSLTLNMDILIYVLTRDLWITPCLTNKL